MASLHPDVSTSVNQQVITYVFSSFGTSVWAPFNISVLNYSNMYQLQHYCKHLHL